MAAGSPSSPAPGGGRRRWSPPAGVAALRPDVAEALAGTTAVETLTPAGGIHAYATRCFADFFGLRITPRQDGPERLVLQVGL